MAARRSFNRNLSKWGSGGPIAKPVALLTACIEEPKDAEGGITADQLGKLRLNRQRNDLLKRDFVQLGLGFYSVAGAGQAERRFFGLSYIVPSKEESLVAQPRAKMDEGQFADLIRRLLVKYDQYAAAVRIPSDPMAFLLLQACERIPLGTSAQARRPGEPYYTALTCGPRADDEMLDSWELHGEKSPFRKFVNWGRGRTDMNRPTQDRGGRRFVIRNPEPAPKARTSHVKTL